MTTPSIHNSVSQSLLSKQSFSSHYKVVLIGQHCVGKTSILSQYINHSFIQNYIPTIGLGYLTKEVKLSKVNNHTLSFELWDTSSLEKAQVLNLHIIEEAAILIMIYDLTRKESLDYLKKYYQELKIADHVLLVVVCNKIDRKEETENNKSQGEEFANSINAMFHTTSAKTPTGIRNLFNKIGNKIIRGGDLEDNDNIEDNNNNINDSNSSNDHIPNVKKKTVQEMKTDISPNSKDKTCIVF